MTPHKPDRHAMLARAAETSLKKVTEWLTCFNPAIAHERALEAELENIQRILAELQSAEPEAFSLTAMFDHSVNKLRELGKLPPEPAPSVAIGENESDLKVFEQRKDEPSVPAEEVLSAVASGSGEDDLNEALSRLHVCVSVVAEADTADIRTVISALRASEERCRELEKERDVAIHERKCCHEIYDDIRRSLGYADGKGYPGLAGEVQRVVSRIASLEAELAKTKAFMKEDGERTDEIMIANSKSFHALAEDYKQAVARAEKAEAELVTRTNERDSYLAQWRTASNALHIQREKLEQAESRATALQERVAEREHDGCHKLDTPKQVFFYEQDFYVLSNFSAFNVVIWGIRFQTSEHAYHWKKFDRSAFQIADEISAAPSAHEAFKIAERNKGLRRKDWDEVKVGVMREILAAKVHQHEYVRRKLIATGNRELIEDSWRDSFWGWGPDRNGQNMLGKLWMEIRAALAPRTDKEAK